jgi:hypothetical protein
MPQQENGLFKLKNKEDSRKVYTEINPMQLSPEERPVPDCIPDAGPAF